LGDKRGIATGRGLRPVVDLGGGGEEKSEVGEFCDRTENAGGKGLMIVEKKKPGTKWGNLCRKRGG